MMMICLVLLFLWGGLFESGGVHSEWMYMLCDCDVHMLYRGEMAR